MISMSKEVIYQELQCLPVNELPEGYPHKSRHGYNCWGFTAAVLGWESLTWIDRNAMEDLLERKSVPVKCPQNGDIVVYRAAKDSYAFYKNELTHTAILTDVKQQKILHKPGNGALEVSTVKGAIEDHHYGKVAQYRRPVGGDNYADDY